MIYSGLQTFYSPLEPVLLAFALVLDLTVDSKKQLKWVGKNSNRPQITQNTLS